MVLAIITLKLKSLLSSGMHCLLKLQFRLDILNLLTKIITSCSYFGHKDRRTKLQDVWNYISVNITMTVCNHTARISGFF